MRDGNSFEIESRHTWQLCAIVKNVVLRICRICLICSSYTSTPWVPGVKSVKAREQQDPGTRFCPRDGKTMEISDHRESIRARWLMVKHFSCRPKLNAPSPRRCHVTTLEPACRWGGMNVRQLSIWWSYFPPTCIDLQCSIIPWLGWTSRVEVV